MKIAACAYEPEWHASWEALESKLDGWVADAAGQGAELLVFPEYAGIEATLIGPPFPDPGPMGWVQRMTRAADGWGRLNATLAERHGVHILAGSLCADYAGQVVNRAYLCTPGGEVASQEKMIPTPYERQIMGLSGGRGLTLFDTALGRIGVLICYDSEFPLLARALVEAGADLLLVPSCTDMPQGQTRVRQSCRARAIESQCPVVQAPLIGVVGGCDIVDGSTGRVGIFGPPDIGQPEDGILGQGTLDTAGWVIADLDLRAIAAPRRIGQVGNMADWPMQRRPDMSVPVMPLGRPAED